MPFGYGPAAKLVTLARRLHGELRFVFVGEGSALELVSRTARVFDSVVAANPVSAPAASLLRDADAVLSIMDRDAGAAASRAGKPLFVVDSLLWMRAEVPEPLRRARIYWSQSFGDERGDYAPQPTWIGPLVAPGRAGPSPRGQGLIVNLGGSAAPDDRRPLFAAYARLVLRAVLAAGLAERFDRVSVIGGEPAIAALAGHSEDPRVECLTLSPDEARARMSGAAALLTAPGLTATLEAFHDRTPTWFLPPQNYSQWCTLRRLRGRGLADGALHWQDLPEAPQVPERLPSLRHAAVVSGPILRACQDAGVAERLVASLRSVGEQAPDRVGRQAAFFASLGPCGLDEIASGLRREVGHGAGRRETENGSMKRMRGGQPWTS